MALMLLGVIAASAQIVPHQINSFFEKNGAVRLETQELQNDTIVTVFHRADDVVWSRVVYRIIDMRYKQNYQLYFPIKADDPQYKSLFCVMLNGICQGLPVHAKSMNYDMNPHLENEPETKANVKSLLELVQEGQDDGGGFDLGAMADDMNGGMDGMMDGMEEEAPAIDWSAINSVPSVLDYDAAADKLSITEYYPQYVKNQLKYIIQEIVFFDKHYSRLYSKIIAIAPLYAPLSQGDNIRDALYSQILFWIPFDALRPYMAHQYMIPQKNDTKRVTFDEFFAKKLYTSYLIGDVNMYDRMIYEAYFTDAEIKQEQERIQTELLNYEQDLWEY